jgi:hypothetical protein
MGLFPQILAASCLWYTNSKILMAQPLRGRNYKLLGLLMLFALAYGTVIYTHHTLTGGNRADGIIGALLGLYICSQGAANILDMLFFGGAAAGRFLSRRSLLSWLGLNILVLFIGWVVIVLGTTRFTAPY